ncbi:hypothetical protein U1Q18_014500 [Sarracenia purpurea var. burkii]
MAAIEARILRIKGLSPLKWGSGKGDVEEESRPYGEGCSSEDEEIGGKGESFELRDVAEEQNSSTKDKSQLSPLNQIWLGKHNPKVANCDILVDARNLLDEMPKKEFMENIKVASGAASKVDKVAESTSVLALTSKVSDPVSVLNVSSNSHAENVSVISEVHEVFDSDRGVKRIGDKGERRFNDVNP